MQQRIFHASATSYEFDNHHHHHHDDHDDHHQFQNENNEEDEHDVFVADWDDVTSGQQLPVLPLHDKGLASSSANVATEWLRLKPTTAHHAQPAAPTTTFTPTSSALYNTDAESRRFCIPNDICSHDEAIGSNHDDDHHHHSSHKECPQPLISQQHHPQQEEPQVRSLPRNVRDEEEYDKSTTGADQRVERFWKHMGDFFGVSTSTTPSSTTTVRTPPSSYSPTTYHDENKTGPTVKRNSANQTDRNNPSNNENSTRSPIHNTSRVRSSPIKMPDSATMKVSSTSARAAVDGPGQRQQLSEGNAHNMYSTRNTTSPPGLFHRAQSDVSRRKRNAQPLQEQPQDVHDEKGHIWRSKFCILQDGVLFFYRNQTDGESSQAKAERVLAFSSSSFQSAGRGATNGDNNNKNYAEASNTSCDSLARSPIPRKRIATPLNHQQEEPVHLWEKRVEVQSIGAVRSAETEYGPHCFALLSPPSSSEPLVRGSNNKDDEEEDEAVLSIENADDKLILRAQSAKEMAEWLFQFHRSIALFVRSLIQNVGVVDLNPTTARIARPLPLAAPGTSLLLSPISSTTTRSSPCHVVLSHGHGRAHSLRRKMDSSQSALSECAANHGYGNKSAITPPRRIKQLSDDGIQWVRERPKPRRLISSSTDRTLSTSSQSTASSSTVHHHHHQSPLTRKASSSLVVPEPAAAATTETNDSHEVSFSERNEMTPELSAPPSINPETERPIPAKDSSGGRKYIPPHKRKIAKQTEQKQQQQKKETTETSVAKPVTTSRAYVPPHLRNNKKAVAKSVPPSTDTSSTAAANGSRESLRPTKKAQQSCEASAVSNLKLGGCADPRIVAGSIMDSVFVPRKASKLKRELRTDPFGYRYKASERMTWDIGAVSECGIRESNEDSYLVAGNLLEALNDVGESTFNQYAQQHPPGLFCVFDGHLGDQAARYTRLSV